MSQAQRIIVRVGLSTQIPQLKMAELGMDTDTFTLRLGNDTPTPLKIMSTGSTGDFDFSSTGTVTFNNVEFSGNFGGVDLPSLFTDTGIVISLGSGEFRQTAIISSDNSVIVSNPKGQSGNIDLRVSTDSIQNALGDIQNQLTQQADQITQIQDDRNSDNDTLLKLVQLTGVPAKQTDLGTFLGDVIPDNATIKTALQALESAINSSDTSQFHLEIVGRQIDSLGIQLKPDNIAILESASETLAGLMSGLDKQKLDLITVTDHVDLDQIFLSPYTPDPDQVNINMSNGETLRIFGATPSQSGVMSASDKAKLDLISATQNVDLDSLQTRVTNLEDNVSTAFMIETDTVLWQSASDDTSHDIDITAAGLIGFEIEYDRVTDGSTVRYYDDIVVNNVILIESENVTKSYTGQLIVFKARNGGWYYLNEYNVGIQLAPNTATSLHIDIGNSNSVTIKQLTVA